MLDAFDANFYVLNLGGCSREHPEIKKIQKIEFCELIWLCIFMQMGDTFLRDFLVLGQRIY